MQTFKVLSALLSYPDAPLQEALPELAAAIRREALLPEPQRSDVLAFIERLRQRELIAWQESYVALFDRGRALSLHIFEHVHGESRDRGQAMVELLAHYRARGFLLNARELPDYIPVLLEFLSRQPLAEARGLLSDALPVLALLGARLHERDSDYRVVFEALASLVGGTAQTEAMRAQVANEGPDETLVNMDRIWEEEAVTFMPGPGGCKPSMGTSETPDAIRPVRWVESPSARSVKHNGE